MLSEKEKRFPAFFGQLVDKYGYPDSRLSEEAGLATSYVGLIRNGRKNPSPIIIIHCPFSISHYFCLHAEGRVNKNLSRIIFRKNDRKSSSALKQRSFRYVCRSSELSEADDPEYCKRVINELKQEAYDPEKDVAVVGAADLASFGSFKRFGLYVAALGTFIGP